VVVDDDNANTNDDESLAEIGGAMMNT